MRLKKNIKIYTTENCGYCKKAKALLNLYKVDYEELVIKDEGEKNDTIEEFSVTLAYQWWESVADGVV